MRVRPTEKLFLTVNPQCGYFSEGTPSEKYFSDGIRIFLCVFAHTEKYEILVVVALASASAGLNRVLLKWRDGCNLTQDK